MAFLYNSWYAALWADELTEAPLPRTILGKPLVFYRGASGTVHALSDTCPHRFAPLHKGRIAGEALACAYHGLQFGPDGRCAHNPHGPLIGSARVESYPLAQRYGIHWVWIGSGKADMAKLPQVPELEDAGLVWVHGTIGVAADYRLMIDNLMDLSHVEFMHPMLGSPGSSERVEYQARVEQDWVFSSYQLDNEPISAVMRMLWPDGPEFTKVATDMRWSAPANLVLAMAVTHAGGDLATPVLRMPTTHFLTPETASSTHYFWGASRNVALDNAELTEGMKMGAVAAFKYEDEPMIAAIQQRMALLGDSLGKPLLLSTDTGAVLARRLLDQRIAEQAEG